jgi:PAS domain S-box-containing protein
VCAHSINPSEEHALSPAAGITAVLDGKLRSYSHEYPCHSPDVQRWFHMHVTPFEGAKIVGAVVTHTDITDRKLADTALREREQQLARVLAGSSQGFWDLNVQTQSFEVGARLEELLGYACGEMKTAVDKWHVYIHPEDLKLVFSSIRRQVAGESNTTDMELRMKAKTGAWRWMQSRGRIVTWDDAGKPLMMSGTLSDITERKEFEWVQKEAATVFSSSYEGIIMVSADLLITKVNPSFTRITGYTAQEAIGQSPQMLSSGKQEPGFFEALWDAVHSVGFWSGEIWDRRKNGEPYAALMSISAVRAQDQGVQHYVGGVL